MGRRKADREALGARLGYGFRDPLLLERALTHMSAVGGEAARSNQRLEFLGDRVLGLAVSELLLSSFPAAAEGELSHRLSVLVRRETCAALAAEWDLGAHLVLGPGEGRTGGRRNRAILSDAAEAVLGAVFLDGGYEAARDLVARNLMARLETAAPPLRDPKTALQEWALGSGRPAPTYAILARSGPDHAPKFRVAARVTGLADGEGEGSSKRAAEQEAAAALLAREGVVGQGGGGHAADA